MVKKAKTTNGAGDSETTVATVPTKNKIVKPVPSGKVGTEAKKVKPAKNEVDANTNGTSKGLKKAKKLKEKVEKDEVPQNEEHVAVPAKKDKTSKTPVADDSVVSNEAVQPVAKEEPEKSAENGKDNKLKHKNEKSVEENGGGEAVPLKKKRKRGSKQITAGTTIDKVPGMKPELTKEKRAKIFAKKCKKAKKRQHQKVLDYLNLWKNCREKWKYQKLKQIFIQENIFNEKIFDADQFQIALEYLGGMKGKSLSNMLIVAKLVIKDIDSAPNADDSAKESVKYQRARELLQTLA